MIKILPYMDHPNKKKILDRYMYLVACALPFSPEDILGDMILEIDGEIIKADNFLEKSGKRPRRRTKHYIELLNHYKVTGDSPFKEDYLLAINLISDYSKDLHDLLFVEDSSSETKTKLKHGELLKILLSSMNDKCLKDYMAIKKNRNLSSSLVENVFRYDSFSNNNKHAALLIKDMGISTCPYCNRQYTVTVARSNNDKYIRPQFDHFKSKSNYPYFSVSLLNLIPCCSLCNHLKSDKDENIIYPYFEEMGNDVVFSAKEKKGLQYLLGEPNSIDDFKIELIVKNSAIKEKAEASDNVFNLTNIYNTHKDYVLLLFQKRYIYNESYLEFIFKTFPSQFHSIDEIRKDAYLMNIEPSQWGEIPLSKLTHDIDLEIKELLSENNIKRKEF